MEQYYSSEMYAKLSAYVPESHFFDGKSEPVGKIFYHDVAVLDAMHHFEILAERGFQTRHGTAFFDLFEISTHDMVRLQSFLAENGGCMLLGIKKASLLFFSEWYASCKLCIAIRISADEQSVRRVLNEAESRSMHPIFGKEAPTAPLALQLAEIFYYAGRLRKPDHPLPVQCLTLANFAGCKLHRLNLPMKKNTLTCDEFQRFSAFLLCLFLTLRHRNGQVQIGEPTDADTDLPLLRPEAPLGVRVKQCAPQDAHNAEEMAEEAIAHDILPFLAHPAFQYFRAWRKGETWSFELAFPSADELHTYIDSVEFFNIPLHARRVCFAMEFESPENDE